MRALRDFNIPKIVTDDMQIFMGLIKDLFPALDVPRKRDIDFERQVRQAAIDLKLQPEDNFILKVRKHNFILYGCVSSFLFYNSIFQLRLQTRTISSKIYSNIWQSMLLHLQKEGFLSSFAFLTHVKKPCE